MSDPSHPWSTDRTLDRERARRVLEGAFPELELEGLEWAGAGWDFDVYRAGGWAFRFPRRAEYARNASWEAGLFRLVEPVLAPLGVRLPVPELQAPPGDHFPYPVTAHRWVPGVDASDLPTERALRHLPRLGQVLKALHALPPEEARAAGVPRHDWPASARLAETHGDLPRLESLLGPGEAVVREAMEAVAALSPSGAPSPPAEARLIHGDLAAEHILLDPDTGALEGIIDWSDAAVGDPANDLVGVVAVWGSAGLERILGGYGPVADGLVERAAFMARVSSLHWLHDALVRGEDGEKERRWIRNAFGAASH